MATRAYASAVFPIDVDFVWQHLRDFTAPGRLISTIESCEMEDGAGTSDVGAVRTMRWASGEERQHRLVQCSDQKRQIKWELVGANHLSEVMSVVGTIHCVRISDDQSSFVEWYYDYSADVNETGLIAFDQEGIQDSLEEMRTVLMALADVKAMKQ